MAGVGIKEVAARAGVAIGTVSNVLNRRDLVAPETRQRVLDAIEELGYVRNESARALRAGKSRTIALVVLDAANPFFADVSNGVEPVVADIGSILVVCDTAGDLRRERRYLAQLEEQRVQGILITPVGGDDDALRRLSERGTPVVLVDSGAPRHGGCSVTVDDVLGGNLAVTHLLEAGRRRIALVGGHAGIRQVDDRREGAHEAVAAAGGKDIEVSVFDTPALSIAAGRGDRRGDRGAAGHRAPDGCLLRERPSGARPDGAAARARRDASPTRWRSSATTTSSSPASPSPRCRRSASPGPSWVGRRPSCWRRSSTRARPTTTVTSPSSRS